jgi:tetratricopeptide (TPR) repeat protein
VAVAAVAANLAFHPARQAPAIVDARPAHRPPPDAVDLYLRGTYAWNERTPESLGKAVAFFNDAIARDPDYAAAYAGLANAYNLLAQYTSHAGTSAYAQAHAAAERARALDPNNADAYAALGFATFYGGHNLAEASTLLRKALALDPNQARIWHWYAMITMHTGKFDEPLAAIRRAQELAPDQRAILANRGLITFLAGESDEALSILTDLVESAPDFLPPHHYLASIYLDQGRYGDYLHESLRATELDRDEDAHAMFEAAARAFDQGGAPAMLTEMLADQTARYTAGNESAFNVARTAAVLGKRQLALDYLLKSKDAGEPEFVGIHVDTMLKSLHDDETYRHLAAAAF